MTIDECILDCIHYTSTDLCKYEKIHWNKPQIEQLTEWLEELKFLRQWKSDVMNEETNNILYENCKRLLTEERNKAIDELVKAIKEKYPEDKNAIIHIEIIAEKLKGGETI